MLKIWLHIIITNSSKKPPSTTHVPCAMDWNADDGNDLESFLLGEVPAPSKTQLSADEFDDIDWCDIGEALNEDVDVSENLDSNPVSNSLQEVSGAGLQGESRKVSKESKDEQPKVRRQCKALREQAVSRFHILVLSFVSRLHWLNQICKHELLQAAILSLTPLCLNEGVKLSLKKLKTHIQSTNISDSALPLGLFRLIRALHGGGSNIDLIMLLISRCRSQSHPARLVLSLPLPGAKTCGNLLKGEVLPEPSIWAEIFDSSVNRWRALGVPSGHSSYWILAMGSEDDLWDVTGRYGRWSSILDSRGSLLKVWNQLLERQKLLTHVTPVASEANQLDLQWLQQLAEQEPIPTSRAQFKCHRVFVLDSQVRQDQLVTPESKPVGLFQGKEAIWRREDVKELCSAHHWRQQGRLVRQDERPMKVLRRDSIYCSKLFGRWQTEELPKEAQVPVVGGPIPGTNNYGNIEVKQGVPEGCVHIDDEAARMAAPKLGVEFAPAVINFRKERGQLKPVYSGCVIWSRDEADLRRAAEEERQRLEELQHAKRSERLKGAWQLLVKNVLLDIYVESRYNTQSPG